MSTTFAASCAEPSGWLGTHVTTRSVPVGTTDAPPATVTDGASGGTMVVTGSDSVHAERSEPMTERTR